MHAGIGSPRLSPPTPPLPRDKDVYNYSILKVPRMHHSAPFKKNLDSQIPKFELHDL